MSTPLTLPGGISAVTATGICHGETAGYASYGTYAHALLWNGAAGTVIDLDPGLYGSYAAGIDGTTECGYAANSQYVYYYGGGKGGGIHKGVINFYHASIWHGSGKSVVDLNPVDATFSYAFAVSGSREAGAAIFGSPPSYEGPEYAYVWTGTAASAVDIDGGYTWSQANCAGPTNVGGVGSATLGANPHAILWTGPTYTIVDLHPAAYPTYSSTMTCLDDSRDQQGGFLYIYDPTTGGYDDTAFLWSGNPNGVSLAPAGSTSSEVLAMRSGYQVGYAIIGGVEHAIRWHGTAASAVDLGPGIATAIDTNGDILGTSTAAGTSTAVIWTLSTTPHLAITQSVEPNANGWCNAPVTLTVQSPFTTGTPSIGYHWNSASSTTVAGSTASITQSGQGTHYLSVNAANGKTTTATEQVTINVDTVPPSTKEALAAGAFTLTSTDSSSGVEATYYSLDGGSTTAYIGPVSVTNVVHTLQYWSVDKAGNVETTHTATLPVEPPTITLITPGYLYTGSPDTTITVTGVDFDATSVVQWNGKALATTYVSGTSLTAVVPAADLTKAATENVTVKSTVGTSTAFSFYVAVSPDS